MSFETVTVEPKSEVVIASFAVEIDHPRNNDVLLQAIPGCRLRSAISSMKPIIDQRTGEARVPVDQARDLSFFPQTPGMQVHIKPDELTYRIVDPVHGDDELCERIQKRIEENSSIRTGQKVRGVPPQRGELDIHRMKTLCREMIWLLNENHVKIVKGVKPKIEDVNDMVGRYLLNPGSRVHNTQPMYEDSWDNWVSQLQSVGG